MIGYSLISLQLITYNEDMTYFYWREEITLFFIYVLLMHSLTEEDDVAWLFHNHVHV